MNGDYIPVAIAMVILLSVIFLTIQFQQLAIRQSGEVAQNSISSNVRTSAAHLHLWNSYGENGEYGKVNYEEIRGDDEEAGAGVYCNPEGEFLEPLYFDEFDYEECDQSVWENLGRGSKRIPVTMLKEDKTEISMGVVGYEKLER